MPSLPAARVGDPIAHTMAFSGALIGLGAGLLIGGAIAATIITGGAAAPMIAVAVGGALAAGGGGGMAGQYIGESIMGSPCGAIQTGSPNVFINGLPAARSTLSLIACGKHGPSPQKEATGSSTVYINRMPAGRESEKATCSAIILEGSPNVLIGGDTVQTETMRPEVSMALSKAMQAMMWGGTIIATGGIAAGYGVFAAAGSLIGGFGGGYLGSLGGGWVATQLGFGETGRRVGEVVGGLGGGILGGNKGFRGGRALDSRYQVIVDPGRLGMNGGNIRIIRRPPNARPRGPDGRFTSSGQPPPRYNRNSQYPSGYRSGVRDTVLDAHTIRSGPNAGKVRTADGDIVARNDPRLTIEHSPAVVEHWNQTGYNSTRAVRNDFYNETSNMSLRLKSENSADGGRMSAAGIRYRQDVGPNHGQ